MSRSKTRNPETMEVIKEYKLPITEVDGARYRYFPSTKKHYLNLNKQLLYEVHPNTYNLEDVKETIFRNQQEFTSGIALVKFISRDAACDGFTAVTNMGKEYYYCPGPDKLYTSREYYDQRHNLLPGAVEKSLYLFTTESADYPDEELQLMKIKYMYNNGGPASIPKTVKWENKLIWVGSSTYRKKLLEWDKHSRFVSYRDLTPGRFYIKPEVLYGDSTHVLIRWKPTASPDAVASIQLLDAEGKLLWTLPGIYNVEWENYNTVLITDKYLWMCIDDGYSSNREHQKFLRIKLDGTDSTTFEMPRQFKL